MTEPVSSGFTIPRLSLLSWDMADDTGGFFGLRSMGSMGRIRVFPAKKRVFWHQCKHDRCTCQKHHSAACN
jgi:hypothetical protein